MEQNSVIARRLVEAFMQFRKVHWQQSPIAGLKHSEVVVLGCIAHFPHTEPDGVKMSEISSTLKLALPTVTELVTGLVQNGYAERNQDSQDRRAVRIRLTEAGALAIQQVQEAFLRSFGGLVDCLGQEKSNQLIDLLSQVFTYFDQLSRLEMNMDA